jgi:HYR domain-containing protein
MKTTASLLLSLALCALASDRGGTDPAAGLPMVVHNLAGTMHFFEDIPVCDDPQGDVAVTGGRLDITPAFGRDLENGNKQFSWTRGSVSMAPFSVDICGGARTETISALSLQLANAVTFVGVPAGRGRYDFSIPRDRVQLLEQSTRNGLPDRRTFRPRDPVTGTIDLDRGTVSMRVVVSTQTRVEAGDIDGLITTNLSGDIRFPDGDRDGVPDHLDNCPGLPNRDQGRVASPIVRATEQATLHSCLETRIGRALATDVCENRRLAVTNDAPHPFPLGTTVVTWRAEDDQGRVGTDTERVTVDDTTVPMFTSMPPDLRLLDCRAAILGRPAATDDCGGTPRLTNDAPARFPVGPTVVTWTATDLSGNEATATQTVTVMDRELPEVTCGPAAHGRGPAEGAFFQVSASDHCDVPTIRLGPYVLALGEVIKITETSRPGVRLVNEMGPDHLRHFQVGRGEGVVTATDASGNVASAACR